MNYQSARELGKQPELVLIRGLPGGGKSTMARAMAGHIHLENDMYFVDHDGQYRYSAELMQSAFEWCQAATKNALLQGHSVVVSNTFVRRLEWLAYGQVAGDMGITLRIIEANGAYQNTHAVPACVVERMRQTWETI